MGKGENAGFQQCFQRFIFLGLLKQVFCIYFVPQNNNPLRNIILLNDLKREDQFKKEMLEKK